MKSAELKPLTIKEEKTKMKRLIIFILFLYAATINSQSVLTYGTGTSIGILTGADLCANVKYGSGVIYGGGTFCGGSIYIETISAEIPDKFYLQQNYPNPFNPITKIQFDVMKTENVMITVFDIAGKELEVLVNERMQPGTYETEWNGEKYASGIYFYRMEAGKYVETRKMILMK